MSPENPPEGAAQGPGPVSCPSCATSMPADANFCPQCGAGRPGAGIAPPPPSSGGMPTAIWIVLIGAGCLIAGIVPVAIIAAIAIPNLIAARQTGNETSAIGTLRTIATAQYVYREGDYDGDEVLDYAGSLTELSQAGLVDAVVGSGTRSGYRFDLSGSTYEWQARATPVTPSTGRRNFIVCVDGVVRFSGTGAATCSSPAIQ